MADQKEIFKAIVVKAIEEYKSAKAPDAEVKADTVRVEIPPKPEMGDLGIPMQRHSILLPWQLQMMLQPS